MSNAGEAIILRRMFDLVQSISKARAKKYTSAAPGKRLYPFTGLLVCGACGKSCKRKVAHGTASWNCGTFLRQGKLVCYGKQIPEDALVTITAEVLGVETLSDEVLQKRLERIVVPAPYRLLYKFRDGREVACTWEPRSRRDSWDDAARQRAREHGLRRWST